MIKKMPNPTHYLPGTNEKVEVMRKRIENKEELWHKDDQKVTMEIAMNIVKALRMVEANPEYSDKDDTQKLKIAKGIASDMTVIMVKDE